jgi:5-methylcytosine-specific restriction endonuclease McrA
MPGIFDLHQRRGPAMGWETSNRNTRLPWNWKAVRVKVLTRDNKLCKLRYEGCLIKATEVDHIVRGDNHSMENLRAVCSECHKKKTSVESRRERLKLRELKKRPAENHPGLRKTGGHTPRR